MTESIQPKDPTLLKLVDTSTSPAGLLVTINCTKNTVAVSQLGVEALILPDDPFAGAALQHPLEERFVLPGEEGYAELFIAYVRNFLMPAHNDWQWEPGPLSEKA